MPQRWWISFNLRAIRNPTTTKTFMIQEFIFWLKIGFTHILDWQGYDHMLFLLILGAGFTFKNWKSLFILITAFTVGHCLTLVLSTAHWIKIPAAWIEFLIPITILSTAILQLLGVKKQQTFALVFFFGLIHGMGFSTLLKAMLGQEEFIILPLSGFNLGIELGQIIWVLLLLSIHQFVIELEKKFSGRLTLANFVLGYTYVGMVIALYLAVSRLPF